jgi:hypothetical protein
MYAALYLFTVDVVGLSVHAELGWRERNRRGWSESCLSGGVPFFFFEFYFTVILISKKEIFEERKKIKRRVLFCCYFVSTSRLAIGRLLATSFKRHSQISFVEKKNKREERERTTVICIWIVLAYENQGGIRKRENDFWLSRVVGKIIELMADRIVVLPFCRVTTRLDVQLHVAGIDA